MYKTLFANPVTYTKYIYISYDMGMRDLPDIYTQCPRVYISGKS